MGYLDRQLTGSSAQAVTTGTTYSTDVIDLASAGRDLGRMNELRAYSIVGTTFTSGGSGTMTVALVESANADLSSPTVLFAANGGTAYAVAALTAGTVLVDIAVPQTTKRYIGWRYVVATADMTAGTITSTIKKNTETPIANRPTGNTGLA